MATHKLIVFSNPSAGQEDEYNRWYDEVHLKEVLEVDGFVAAQRFALADAQIAAMDGRSPTRYLAIYEIEAEDLQPVLDKLAAAGATMNMSDALDQDGALAVAFSPVGPRREAP